MALFNAYFLPLISLIHKLISYFIHNISYLSMRDTIFYSKKTLKLKGKIVDLTHPIVMGILNITPDSFYDGGKYHSQAQILRHVEKMLSEGATIIDIGGYSSRPQAEDVAEKEERKRILFAIHTILKAFPDTLISVDTFRAAIAETAILEGACLINDISGGAIDEKMFETIARLQVPYILTHTRGTPQTMVDLTDYENIVADLFTYFHQKVAALRKLGVEDIIVDLGFGFAKTREQNFLLLKKLAIFRLLNLPLLVGISRKSMIWKTLEITPDEALNGTTALHALALANGASILRVHDVKEAMQTIKLVESMNG
jgi:dihydropteroate synthase